MAYNVRVPTSKVSPISPNVLPEPVVISIPVDCIRAVSTIMVLVK